jgi:hypothetical protein
MSDTREQCGLASSTYLLKTGTISMNLMNFFVLRRNELDESDIIWDAPNKLVPKLPGQLAAMSFEQVGLLFQLGKIIK